MSYLVDNEKEVTDVKGDIPADIRIEHDVTHGAFPDTVEVDTDKVAVSVDDRRA